MLMVATMQALASMTRPRDIVLLLPTVIRERMSSTPAAEITTPPRLTARALTTQAQDNM